MLEDGGRVRLDREPPIRRRDDPVEGDPDVVEDRNFRSREHTN